MDLKGARTAVRSCQWKFEPGTSCSGIRCETAQIRDMFGEMQGVTGGETGLVG